MTTKTDFSEAEWNSLLLAPVNSASYIMTADMSVMGAFREMKAMSKAIAHPSVPAPAQELVESLVADITEKAEKKESMKAPTDEEGEDAREPARKGLQEAVAIVDAKCLPEEAAGFKQWLLDVAQAVAEADKEGSHFGFGGVRVSDKEMAALAEIKSYLGL